MWLLYYTYRVDNYLQITTFNFSIVSGPVYEMFKRCDKCDGKESKFMIFPTIHDAVLFAQTNVMNAKWEVPNGKTA